MPEDAVTDKRPAAWVRAVNKPLHIESAHPSGLRAPVTALPLGQ